MEPCLVEGDVVVKHHICSKYSKNWVIYHVVVYHQHKALKGFNRMGVYKTKMNETDDGCPSSLTLHEKTINILKMETDEATYLNKNTLIIGKRQSGKTLYILH